MTNRADLRAWLTLSAIAAGALLALGLAVSVALATDARLRAERAAGAGSPAAGYSVTVLTFGRTLRFEALREPRVSGQMGGVAAEFFTAAGPVKVTGVATLVIEGPREDTP